MLIIIIFPIIINNVYSQNNIDTTYLRWENYTTIPTFSDIGFKNIIKIDNSNIYISYRSLHAFSIPNISKFDNNGKFAWSKDLGFYHNEDSVNGYDIGYLLNYELGIDQITMMKFKCYFADKTNLGYFEQINLSKDIGIDYISKSDKDNPDSWINGLFTYSQNADKINLAFSGSVRYQLPNQNYIVINTYNNESKMLNHKIIDSISGSVILKPYLFNLDTNYFIVSNKSGKSNNGFVFGKYNSNYERQWLLNDSSLVYDFEDIGVYPNKNKGFTMFGQYFGDASLKYVEFNKSGTILGPKTINIDIPISIFSIDTLKDFGGYIITGSILNKDKNSDFALMKLDNNYELEWYRTWGTNENETLSAVKFLENGDLIVQGFYKNGTRLYLAKLKETFITSVVDEQSNDIDLISPNPANNFINLNLNNAKNVEILSFTGQSIITYNDIQNNTLDISGLSKGVYYIKVSNAKGTNVLRFVKN